LGENGVKTNKYMGVSQLLMGRIPPGYPQSLIVYAYDVLVP